MNAGIFANLQCSVVSGDLPVTIMWTYPHDNLTPSDMGISIMKVADRVSLLTISVLQAHHWGNYTCVAENVAGVSVYSTPLVINGLLQQTYI